MSQLFQGDDDYDDDDYDDERVCDDCLHMLFHDDDGNNHDDDDDNDDDKSVYDDCVQVLSLWVTDPYCSCATKI